MKTLFGSEAIEMGHWIRSDFTEVEMKESKHICVDCFCECPISI